MQEDLQKKKKERRKDHGLHKEKRKCGSPKGVYINIYIDLFIFLPKNVNNNSNNGNNLKRKKCVTKDERNATISS